MRPRFLHGKSLKFIQFPVDFFSAIDFFLLSLRLTVPFHAVLHKQTRVVGRQSLRRQPTDRFQRD